MIDHIKKAIREALFSIDPWPHILVKNIFPDDYYADMLSNVPHHSEGQWNKLGKAMRYLYWIEKDGVPELDIHPFWAGLRSDLFPMLREELEAKFQVKGSYYGGELLADFPGYTIMPHTDTTDKLITGLFYLPKDDRFAKHGTTLYKNDTPDPTGKGHRATAEFVPRVVTPYVPNTALFFLRTDVSYHGVVKTPPPVERLILAFDVFR